MSREQKYKIIIIVLSVLVIFEGVLFMISRPKKIIPVLPAKPLADKIAIVLDDWGYNLNNLPLASQIKYPLTISILPNLRYSRTVAEKLHQAGFEEILHLPMEPLEKLQLEKDTILTLMSQAQIQQIIDRDLSGLVYLKGVSNHMGSKATEDPRIMEIVFKKLKERHLYFLDSFVSARSVGAVLAKKMQLASARRDIFLDNQEDPVYIKRQIYKLKLKAKASGQAIGIGHDRKNTLQVLKEVMPQLEKEGYKFVFVSQLVE